MVPRSLLPLEKIQELQGNNTLGVGRTTAQKIYETARKKIADALVLGFALKIVAASFSFVAAVQTFAIKKTASNGKFKKNSKQKMDQIL